MAKFNDLAKAFDKAGDKAKLDNKTALKRSIIVVNAIEKLKRQGIKVTKKAELDYILAKRHVEKASLLAQKDLMLEYRDLHGEAERTGPIPEEEKPPVPNITPVQKEPPPKKPAPKEPPQTTRRTPEKNPAEFQKATQLCRKIVVEVDLLQQLGKAIPLGKMEEYSLAKKFLAKFDL